MDTRDTTGQVLAQSVTPLPCHRLHAGPKSKTKGIYQDSKKKNDLLGQDDDEIIEVEQGVALEEAKRRVLEGDMPAPAAMVTLLAIDKLRQLGHI